MSQKPLIYALVVTLVVVLVGFVYLNFFAMKSGTPSTTIGTKAKVTLPPEPESPRVFNITPVQTGTGAGATKPKMAKMERVSITANGFVPDVVTIAPGDLVTWTNNDTISHKIKGKSWGSGNLLSGEGFTQEFDVAGIFSYSDEINPNMTGRIEIK